MVRAAYHRGPVRPWSIEWAGRVDEHVIVSDALRGNPLGDPHERPLWVYVPPGYDENTLSAYPVAFMQDGQNLFEAARSFAGDWGVVEIVRDAVAANAVEPLIVVGIDNTGVELKRLQT